MRKLKLSCTEGATHHALATLAITEAGLTKGFGQGRGIAHSVVLDDEGVIGNAGDYHLGAPDSDVVKGTTITQSGCICEWRFRWPDLKLLGYEVSECWCS